MKMATVRAREIEREIRHVGDLKSRIDKLRKTERESVSAIAAKKEALVMDLARESGLLDLPPSRIVAAFEKTMRQIIVSEEVTEVVALGIDALETEDEEPTDGLAAVVRLTIKFGNHAKSDKVLFLRSIPGLTRNGKLGVWHGEVDREALPGLQRVFGSKLQIDDTRMKRLPNAARQDDPSELERPTQVAADVGKRFTEGLASNEIEADQNVPDNQAEKVAGRPTDARGLPEATPEAENKSGSLSVGQVSGISSRSPFFAMQRPRHVTMPVENSSDQQANEEGPPHDVHRLMP